MNILISWNMVTALWIIFCVYWTVSAMRVKRTRRTESSALRVATVAVLGCGAVLVFSRATNFGILSRRFIPDEALIKAIAVALVACGISIAIWARRHLGEFWSARVTLKEDHQLIQTGPYARVRHPIYSGLLLAMIGTGLFVGEWRAVLGVFLIFVSHWLKALREEKLLVSQFGSTYEDYRRRTGSLVPRLL
jgi:protein-S-isoprenylcysteine O-methyltransferase Ste14